MYVKIKIRFILHCFFFFSLLKLITLPFGALVNVKIIYFELFFPLKINVLNMKELKVTDYREVTKLQKKKMNHVARQKIINVLNMK